MTNKGIDIKHPKLRGEWAELRFMARAAEHGLCVTKPWGDTARYDFAVEHKGRFLRVQVKSTMYKCGESSYRCNVVRDGEPYERNDVDFIAAYVIQEELWYVIPAEEFRGQTRIRLSPHRKDSKFYRYKEAWDLLRGEAAKRPRASSSAPAKSETGACEQDCDPPTDHGNGEGEDDAPQSIVEARFRAIKWNPIFPSTWKPRG